MKQNDRFLKGVFSGFIVALIIVAFIFFAKNFWLSGSGNTDAASIDSKKVGDKVELIERIIDQYYLNDKNPGDLEEGIYEGLMLGLEDPYSVYYTAEEYKEVQESVSGKYSGIGVLVSQGQDGSIRVIKVFENSPGLEAGLRPRDIIYKVGNDSVEGRDLSAVVAQIKGEAGTDVDITVIRDGVEVEITVTRKNIEVQTVEHRVIDGSIGYVLINSFDTVTLSQFENALNDLKSQNVKSIIFDVRDNPGGSLSTVVDMLDLLLPEGLIVYTEDKNGKRLEEKSDSKRLITLPMSVIVNENSASASEIFAGAIKDYELGPIVGKTSFGKGVVQSLLPLSDGSAVKLTVANYFTPKGNTIHDVGVVPNYEVEIPDDAYVDGVLDESKDTQLQKAIELNKGM